MKYCEKCSLKIAGYRDECPLCQGRLVRISDEDEEVYPFIPTIYHEHSLFFKILILLSIVAAVISVTVNLMLPQSGWWSAFVVLGIACLWISLAFSVHKRNNIPKILMYQVVVISLLSILWDYVTHWHGWSLDYVIPIICILAMVSLAITARVMKMPIRDYLIYVCIDALFGIVPIIFYLTGRLGVIYPSLICVAMSIITLAALLIFEGESMMAELKRRLHL